MQLVSRRESLLHKERGKRKGDEEVGFRRGGEGGRMWRPRSRESLSVFVYKRKRIKRTEK